MMASIEPATPPIEPTSAPIEPTMAHIEPMMAPYQVRLNDRNQRMDFFFLSDAVLGARCDARSSTSIRPLPPDA